MSSAKRDFDSPQRRFDAALEDLLSAAHRRGINDGLEVARKIRGWLARQPDREWQRQVREWADAEITRAEQITPH
jgi:hypothetical protein